MALNVVSTDRLSTNVKTSNLATGLSEKVGQNKNAIINGAMGIAQRGTSHTGLGGAAGVYHLDRWRTSHTMTTGRYTVTQDSSGPAGLPNSLKVDITTAEGSLNVASAQCLLQILEGQDVQFLEKGTATAKSLTVSFWVKSTTTGTYILEVQDHDNSRILNKAYTISSADTWEKKTLTFAGDTTGALTDDNGASLLFNFYLAAGTNFTSGTLGTSWAATTNANRAVGQTNLFSSTSNNFYITGIQAEVGDTATDFEHRSYGDELARCQRYCYKRAASATATYQRFMEGRAHDADTARFLITLPVTMRAVPSVAYTGSFTTTGGTYTGTPAVETEASSHDYLCFSTGNSGSGWTANWALTYLADNSATASMTITAEL